MQDENRGRKEQLSSRQPRPASQNACMHERRPGPMKQKKKNKKKQRNKKPKSCKKPSNEQAHECEKQKSCGTFKDTPYLTVAEQTGLLLVPFFPLFFTFFINSTLN